MKQCVRARIKVFEVPRKENDAKGVAVPPFNLDFAAVGEHIGSFVRPIPAAN
jgi:hypothetical protein